MQGKVEIAGVNTAKLKVLKNEETMALLRRTKEGDQEARRQLIEGNLRLVLSVIQRFSNRGENVDDLFQVGCVGLIKAIDNFDVNQPVKFSTYGVPMIIGEIRRYLRDNSAIRVSRSMRDTAYRVLQVRERLISETQREPTVEQIAKELDIPREDVVFAMDAIVDPVSLYEPVYSDGGDALCVMDQVRDTQNTDEHWTDRIALKDALKRLDDREPRWRSPPRWGFPRPRFPGWKKGPSTPSKKIFDSGPASFGGPFSRFPLYFLPRTAIMKQLLKGGGPWTWAASSNPLTGISWRVP